MNGLSSQQAQALLQQHGPNRLQKPTQTALALQFLAHLRNPLVLILLAASVLSALTGDRSGALIIGVIVLMSVTLDFVQAHRAGAAADKLALQVAVMANALRDGVQREVPVFDLVPGDVVLLSAGSLVPADAILLKADDFFVNQAQLTGEPFPIEKKAATAADQAEKNDESEGECESEDKRKEVDIPWELDASDRIFLGSSVVSGSATALIGRTGGATAMGQIAVYLNRTAPPTAFEQGTRQFGMLIMRLTLLMVLFTLLVNVALHRPLLESFLFAVALAVGLTPELLPMVVSVTLTQGALRMAARKVIVKRPSGHGRKWGGGEDRHRRQRARDPPCVPTAWRARCRHPDRHRDCSPAR